MIGVPLNLRIAMKSLAAHKLRAILAMLGVFLGALAVTGVQHVSQIMIKKTQIETAKLGPNLFVAVSGNVRFRRRGGLRVSHQATTFTVADAEAAVGGVPGVEIGTPFISTTMPVRAEGNTVTAQLMAAWPNYEEIRSFRPEFGRFFNWEENRLREKVCVLGRLTASRLFGDPQRALDQRVRIFRAEFRVVGVLEEKGRDLSGENQDEVLIMPLTTFMRRASNQDFVNGAMFRLADGASLESVKESMSALLRKLHKIRKGERPDFSLFSAEDAVELQQQALDLMWTLGVISSSISFAVGGLGILSIMVLVVRARRVEIGIRRAVGGKRSDIVRQFLFEAALMAGIGGMGGVATAMVLVFGVSKIGKLPMVVDVPVIVGVLVGSCLLGVAAGAYPAWQAARIRILEVLRH